MTFADKVALVAGGTGGLGRSVSLAFLSEGARVIVTYRVDQELRELMRLAGAHSSRVTARNVDVTDELAVHQLIAEIGVETGRLDILVNTVGGYAGGPSLWDDDPATLDRMLALNLRSGYVLSRAAAKVMLQHGEGVIVNVASKAALDHGPGVAAYAASKAAGGFDGLARRRSEGQGSASQLDITQHHRHRSQSQGHARRRFFEVAQAR